MHLFVYGTLRKEYLHELSDEAWEYGQFGQDALEKFISTYFGFDKLSA